MEYGHGTARKNPTHLRQALRKEGQSVRAGTAQARIDEGARGESAARCTKCQVGTQSRGRSTNSVGAASSRSGPGTRSGKLRQQAQAVK